MTRLVRDRHAVLALGLTAVVFAVDLSLPLGVAAAVPYTFAVLLALKARPAWFAPFIAGLCWVLTVAKMGIVPERGSTEMWKVIVNRCLALFAIGMTTFLGLRRRRAEAERADAEERVREHLADLARMGRLTTAAQLATGLAHELNQPLAAVCLQAEITGRLADRGAGAADLLPSLREIEEQSRRAAEIVRALRRMIGRGSPTHGLVALADVVRTVARLLDGPARRGDVNVGLDLGSVPPVTGDRVQLEQVVFNLVQNAIEAAAAKSDYRAVTVAVAADGPGRVIVTVRDTGPGLPPGDPERVFEKYFTTKPNGMGMGLAISRSIVESHGGRLWAAPAADGGAVFTFILPTTPR
jgi:C4-dicarboxylate-specific signal transduction histidine kinase